MGLLRVSLRPLFRPLRTPTTHPERVLELPTSHRLPLAWLFQAASPPLQYRALVEVAPESSRDPNQVEALRTAVLEYKVATAIARKQKDSGLWGGNLLATGPDKATGAKEAGTIHQYRHLLELGWPREQRQFRVTDRLLFRLLSRDEDPSLLVEFQRPAKTDAALGFWARGLARDAAAAALARGGHAEDPRLRGAAHRIASDVSAYVRSELATKPFRKAQGKTVLDPAAYPPTLYQIEMLAFMPSIQRERSGFIERLGQYFSTAAPKREYYVQAGARLFEPHHILLGDPVRSDAQGHITDVPFALYWLELLARLGLVRQVQPASRVLARLFSETDEQGVWSPKNLRVQPKSENPLVSHYFPLEGEGRSPAQRQTDVTFRLALIARLMGIPIEIVT